MSDKLLDAIRVREQAKIRPEPVKPKKAKPQRVRLEDIPLPDAPAETTNG